MKKRKSNQSFFSFFKPYNYLTPRRIGLNLTQKILLASGLILISVGLWFRAVTLQSLSFSGEVTTPIMVSKLTYLPVGIELPSIHLSLPIDQTQISGGNWEVSKIGVSHLENSANPGGRGNIILYGHNTLDSLGYLKNVKIGENINIKDEAGTIFTYKIYSIQTVNPENIDALTTYHRETLSIYTCTGFADLKRLLVKAERVK